jgi:hypothetical protein
MSDLSAGLVDEFAAVLAAHARWEHGTGPDGYPTHFCRCGVDLPHGRADRVAPLHRAHVAAALAACAADREAKARAEGAAEGWDDAHSRWCDWVRGFSGCQIHENPYRDRAARIDGGDS